MQDPSGIVDTLNYLLTLSGRGLVFAFLIASYFKKIRWGYQFDELQAQLAKTEARCEKLDKDRDDLVDLMKRSTELNERIAAVKPVSDATKP